MILQVNDFDDTIIVSPVRYTPAATDDGRDDDTIVRPDAAAIAAARRAAQHQAPDDGEADPANAEAAEAAEADAVLAAAAQRTPEHDGTRKRTFARIRIGGSEFALDAPAFIGRNPSTPRIPGRSAYRLVRVPSPTLTISASHVEIRQVGDVAVVTDLDSTNGTIIEAPGAVPVTLRPGDSVVALGGTIVDVGDGIRIEIIDEGHST